MYSNVARFVVSVGTRRVRARVRDDDLRHDSDAPWLSFLIARAVASVRDPALTLHVFAVSLGPKRVPHRTVYEEVSHRPY